MIDVLESAETDLNMVTRSMISADPALLERSQVLLERLVGTLTECKRVAASIPAERSREVRARLQRLQGKLRRLQALGEAAASALGGRPPAVYTATGGAGPAVELKTMSLDC